MHWRLYYSILVDGVNMFTEHNTNWYSIKNEGWSIPRSPALQTKYPITHVINTFITVATCTLYCSLECIVDPMQSRSPNQISYQITHVINTFIITGAMWYIVHCTEDLCSTLLHCAYTCHIGQSICIKYCSYEYIVQCTYAMYFAIVGSLYCTVYRIGSTTEL